MPGLNVGLWGRDRGFPTEQRIPLSQQLQQQPGSTQLQSPPSPNPNQRRGQSGGIDVGRGFMPGMNFPGMSAGLNFGGGSGPRPLMPNPLPQGYGGSNWGPSSNMNSGGGGGGGDFNAGPSFDPWMNSVLPMPPQPPPPPMPIPGQVPYGDRGGFTGGRMPSSPMGGGGLMGSYGQMGGGMNPGNRPMERKLFY